MMNKGCVLALSGKASEEMSNRYIRMYEQITGTKFVEGAAPSSSVWKRAPIDIPFDALQNNVWTSARRLISRPSKRSVWPFRSPDRHGRLGHRIGSSFAAHPRWHVRLILRKSLDSIPKARDGAAHNICCALQ